MNIRKYLKTYLLRMIYNCRITVSGEINILTTDIKSSIIMNDDLFDKVTSYSNDLRILYPYVNIEVVKELHEITIKLFALNRLFTNDKYFENLQLNLSKLVKNVADTDGLNVKVNVNGNIRTWDKTEKFMLVNNKEVISYKITETIEMNKISKTIGLLINNIVCKSQCIES